MSSDNIETDSIPHEAYLAAIASLEHVGPATFRWLLSHGSPSRVWQRLSSGRLTTGPGARITSAQIDRWAAQAASVNPAKIWERCVELGIGVVSIGSAGYPESLADDLDPPVVLFQRGDPNRVAKHKVAIVGTRRATGYGREVAHDLAKDLTEAGITIVSGLALGIDGACHAGAVNAIDEAGRAGGNARGPLAVVGANLESPCPQANRHLASKVAELGIVYSEVPPGTPSAPWRYPVRNRILAALCDVLVVVESDADGGSMHTVREALDRDRTVMAVPGPITGRYSRGTNQLLRDGAAPCLGSDDVLMELGLTGKEGTTFEQLSTDVPLDKSSGSSSVKGTGSSENKQNTYLPSEIEAKLLEHLDWRPTTVEKLGASSGLAPRELATAMMSLESAGLIRRTGSWIERRV